MKNILALSFLVAAIATASAQKIQIPGGNVTTNGTQTLTNKSIAGSQLTGAINQAQMTTTAADATVINGAITFYLKSQAITTSGNPRDIATITLPAGVTRWAVRGNTAVTACSWFVNETQTGSMAAGTLALFDAAAGGGTQMLQTTAPAATSSPTANNWGANAAAVMSISSSLVIRQMANSINTGTISFYVTIYPIP
jgi:hypothetical protein